MPVILPPVRVPLIVVGPTATAYSEESRKLYDFRAAIMKKNEATTSWLRRDDKLGVPQELGIYAEADIAQARTLQDLADARCQFLASRWFPSVDADLPAVLLNEG